MTGAVGARSPLTFAFVTPVYNEADDIDETLAAMCRQTLPPAQIIVINDGSTDGTSLALGKWRDHPAITIIEHERNRGAAAARNSGIRAASSEVVVFLDGDDSPPPDFLERLAAVYERGADSVSVESRVHDDQNVITRFLEAEHVVSYGRGHRANVGWTAGFSCRRVLAEAVGFPEELPGCGGEDGEFFRRLMEKGSRHGTEFSIIVSRRTPTTLGGFSEQWTGRGRPIPYVDRYVRRFSLRRTTLRRLLVALRSVARTALVLPNVRSAIVRTRESPQGWRDFPGFWSLCHLKTLAIRCGEWQSLYRLWMERVNPMPPSRGLYGSRRP